MSSLQPRWSATRYAAASSTLRAFSASTTFFSTALINYDPDPEFSCGFLVVRSDAGAGQGHLDQVLLQVPGAGGAALGAQAAVQAGVFVLHHHAHGLQRARDVEVLRRVLRRGAQPRAQVGLVAVLRERDAVHRADVDAGVALDAQAVGEDS